MQLYITYIPKITENTTCMNVFSAKSKLKIPQKYKHSLTQTTQTQCIFSQNSNQKESIYIKPTIKKNIQNLKSVFIYILYMVYVVGLFKNNTGLKNKLFHNTKRASQSKLKLNQNTCSQQSLHDIHNFSMDCFLKQLVTESGKVM